MVTRMPSDRDLRNKRDISHRYLDKIDQITRFLCTELYHCASLCRYNLWELRTKPSCSFCKRILECYAWNVPLDIEPDVMGTSFLREQIVVWRYHYIIFHVYHKLLWNYYLTLRCPLFEIEFNVGNKIKCQRILYLCVFW